MQAGSILETMTEAPVVSDREAGARALADLDERLDALPDASTMRAAFAGDNARRLLLGIFSSSPFLSELARREPAALHRSLTADPETRMTAVLAGIATAGTEAASLADLMRALRRGKAEIALLIGLADLAGVWPVMRVTQALSDTADAAVASTVRFLFRQAAIKGDWIAAPETEAAETSGYFVLAMGKHGARELNYSSDIDLIVFYDAARARLREGLELQTFFVRLTRDLVRALQERTEDGYVFRTDLRLRPDPGATPVAISTDAALQYYESFGQNWERAAMIKARVAGGDAGAGRLFLKDLGPYIWRKYLDYAAIGVAGHNIKLGRGGIREIEFFAQTQQLIAGGRQPELRAPETLVALARLADRGWIKLEVARDLDAAYQYLRRIEHRLQMIADEQTQTLPDEPDQLERLARFSGYDGTPQFAAALTAILERVARHYTRLFEDMPELTSAGASMVFAGEADDPATAEALSKLGFTQPSQVLAIVRGWHHGRYPAIRTARARERLTEVQPLLIAALARTADPDAALTSFDRFLAELPSGVQLFSLLRQNPNLLELIAAIMGSAPRLARVLSRRRRVLDAVLDPGFFGSLPNNTNLGQIIDAELSSANDYQEMLDRARVVGNEQQFLIGVRVLTGTISASQAGGAYALLAERLIQAVQAKVEAEMIRQYGRVPGGGAAIVAMGKLGGREMTASSDLDLILVYDFDPAATQSDGARPLPVSQYYARLTQRLVSAFTAQTAEGALYDVDMRLRPSGQKGPVATQLSSFVDYQAASAWTWEHLALTRARVISGPPDLRRNVERAIRDVLVKPRDRARIATDVRDMRALIAKEKGSDDLWDLKQVRGGLVDLEFIAQHLQLVHAAAHPKVLDQNTAAALKHLAAAGALPVAAADTLLSTTQLVHNLTQMLRLCLDGRFEPEKAPDGLKDLLARVGEVPDFTTLSADLTAKLSAAASLFDTLVS
jgi:[glutamine synthetase] adenylyltransferase / [glutamine synthetase]-adenylyl-L-tyrosine phosphorylase